MTFRAAGIVCTRTVQSVFTALLVYVRTMSLVGKGRLTNLASDRLLDSLLLAKDVNEGKYRRAGLGLISSQMRKSSFITDAAFAVNRCISE